MDQGTDEIAAPMLKDACPVGSSRRRQSEARASQSQRHTARATRVMIELVESVESVMMLAVVVVVVQERRLARCNEGVHQLKDR